MFAVPAWAVRRINNFWEGFLRLAWVKYCTASPTPLTSRHFPGVPGRILQGFESRSGLDPDSVTLWIRIRIENPDPNPGARKLRNFSGKNALFSCF
jgi:hypothetical protein